MKGHSYFIVILSLFINTISANAVAENIAPSCDKNIYIIHGNGMFTSEEQARYNKVALQEKLYWWYGNLPITDKLKFEVAYNNEVGYVADFLEVYEQYSTHKVSRFWAMLAGLELMPDSLKTKFLKVSEGITESSLSGNANIQEHVDKYNNLLRRGNKVMLVPHSQGNFFGNIAYVGLEEKYKEGFLITQVASPANYIATDPTDTSYITIEEDKVMSVIWNKLPANVDNFPSVEKIEWTGHSFIDSYLLDKSPSLYRIMFKLSANIDKANFPNSLDSYNIPFRLQYGWIGNFDMDMHIIEPDGTHVYSGNHNGSSGKMFYDSTDGYGAELYMPDCRIKLAGTYEIGFERVGHQTDYVWDHLKYYVADVDLPLSGWGGGLGGYGLTGILYTRELVLTPRSDGGYSTKFTLFEKDEWKTPVIIHEGMFYLERK